MHATQMKVCILTSVHSALDDRIFHKQARSLCRAGYKVQVVAPHDRDEEIEGIHIQSVRRTRTRLARMTVTQYRILQKALKSNADVYHFHDPELIPLGILLHLLGHRVIYDVHEYNAQSVLTKNWIPFALRYMVSKCIACLDRMAGCVLDGVVVISDAMSEQFRSASRVVVVHNYAELQHEQHAEDERPTANIVGIYLGGLWKERGLEVLIGAGRRLKRSHPHVDIDIVGPLDLAGVREDDRSIDRWAEYGIRYLGVIDHRDVHKRLRSAQIGLIPWLETPNNVRGIPVKLFEYMYAGLPVVGSDIGCIAQIVKESGCGILVAPGDVEALTRAIILLADNPVIRKEMGSRGRAEVMRKYNWTAEEAKLLGLYKSITGPECKAGFHMGTNTP